MPSPRTAPAWAEAAMNQAQNSATHTVSALAATSPIIELRTVCKSYAKPSGEPMPVLVDIDLTIKEGEIVGLLGRSGSGKSTLLRTVGGLISPTSGSALYRGQPMTGPPDGISIVFQS